MSESDIERIFRKLDDIFELLAVVDKKSSMTEAAQVEHRRQCIERHRYDGDIERAIKTKISTIVIAGFVALAVAGVGAFELAKVIKP